MIKDKLYNYLVRKNGRVWYEYERYVREHMEEHRTHRIKHIILLIKLNWFYRVKKKCTPYLYWDVPVEPVKVDLIEYNLKDRPKFLDRSTSSGDINKVVSGGNNLNYPEIGIEYRKKPSELIIEMLKYDVISFDIFDTLIFRYMSDPKDVFILIGDKLKIYDYKNIRIKAEEDARERKPEINGEVCLFDICEIVSQYTGIDIDRCMQTEIETELEMCYANPYMLNIAKALVHNKKRIIATSNMYLEEKYIRRILDVCGYNFITEIYVSCEEKVSKYKGELQKKVWNKIGLNNTVIHIGDSYEMDYIGSRMAGWSAFYYRNVNEIGRLYRPAKMSKIAYSLYSGIVNAHFHNGMNNSSMYYEIGFGYLGILVAGFCKWINEYAHINRIDKILFTSRDMRIVYDIYNKFYKEIDNDYVYISRFASQRFAYERFSGYFIDSHIRARAQIEKLTVLDVLNELDIKFMSEYLEEYELEKNELFTIKNFDKLKKCLNENKERMLHEFEIEKKSSILYYSQFLKEGQKVAVVDLGWQGTNALCLKYLLEEEMNMKLEVKSLLLAVSSEREFATNSMSLGGMDSYCFSSVFNEQLKNQFSPIRMGRFICELLFSSTEKSLKYIKQKDGDLQFYYIDNEKRDDSQIENIHKGAMDFVDMWEKAGVYNKNRKLFGFEAILPLNKLSYNKNICYEIMKNNEINPWIGEVKSGAASNIRKIVR